MSHRKFVARKVSRPRYLAPAPCSAVAKHRRLLIRSWLVALLGVAVFTSEGSAGFITAPSYAVGMGPQSAAVGDFNGDGIPDLAVANANDGTVSVLLGQGGGTFQASQPYVAGSGPSSGPQSV